MNKQYCKVCHSELICYDPGYEKAFYRCDKCNYYYVLLRKENRIYDEIKNCYKKYISYELVEDFNEEIK